jgi:hypothetical protein
MARGVNPLRVEPWPSRTALRSLTGVAQRVF